MSRELEEHVGGGYDDRDSMISDIEALRARAEAAEKAQHNVNEMCNEAQQERDEAREDVRALAEALEQYGVHQGECYDAAAYAFVHGTSFTCTCGLEAVLARPGIQRVTAAAREQVREMPTP